MNQASILNHVIGPVMRGPSSSHTAGAFHIGRMVRSLLDAEPASAQVAFDVNGSYGRTYHEQGADLAFAMGLMGWELTEARFDNALALAAEAGVQIDFSVQQLEMPDHPNTVDIQVVSEQGRSLQARANSIGGGAVEFTRVAGWPVQLTGRAYEVLVEVKQGTEGFALAVLEQDGAMLDQAGQRAREDLTLLCVRRKAALPRTAVDSLKTLTGVRDIWVSQPVFFVQAGDAICTSSADMVAFADAQDLSLGRAALQYEATLLGLSEDTVLAEMVRRFDVMQQSVHEGLAQTSGRMQLLRPTAGSIYQAEAEGRLAIGGLHTRAAVRAMAVMHVNGGMGVVCAAPTGGAAGTLPGVLVTLVEERGLSREEAALALFAAGAIGVVVSNRATFAAEVAGCQVEIGAAGAMAAAAVVEAAGGLAGQAADAASIAFQNTMGSVCDLVQGMVEIPCHTRNAAAASNAFLCADLILGGYHNPIGLDETVDAVYAVGKMLPSELRCTARGGLAITPSALAMQRLNRV